MSTINKLFTELYRPRDIKYMALPSRVRAALKNGLSQNILLFSASGGTGKTTITRILTEGYETLTINASAERGIDVIREQIQTFAGTYSITNTKNMKVIVLEEMDGLTADSFDALRAVIERYSDTVRFVGNCNNISKIPEPVQSRFLCIPLYAINSEEYAEMFNLYCKHVERICTSKQYNWNIKYTPEDIQEFVKLYFPNMRTILNKLQEIAQSEDKTLNVKNLSSTYDCSQLYQLILDKNTQTTDIYKIVTSDYSDKPDEIIATIGDTFLDYIHDLYNEEYGCYIWKYAIKIAEYCRTLNQTIDKQVHLLGLIGELIEITRGR